MSDSEEAAAQAKRRTILLVEDDTAHAELIRRVFEDTSTAWEINRVTTVNDAAAWIAANTMPFIVLAEYLLPDGKGLELVKHPLRADEVGFPLIIMAESGSAQMAVHTLKSGAIDFLLKSPEEFHELPWRVECAIRDWRVLSRRKRLEQELALYLKELDRAAQDLEDFTLLLGSYADKLDDLGRGYLAGVQIATEKTTVLTEDLLMMIRAGRKVVELEKVDLNELMEEILTDLGPLIEDRDGHVLIGPLPTIATQRVGMKALFSTLIEHSLTHNLAQRPRIELHGEDREHECRFAVKTNNGDLSGKELNHLFAAPQLLSPQEFEGTNVGLSSCTRILARFGGKIWVENGPLAGISYLISIPTT